jgi:GAF domain-containing protein
MSARQGPGRGGGDRKKRRAAALFLWHCATGVLESPAMLVQPMLQRLRAARDLQESLRVALLDVVALHGAERGHIQLLDREGRLAIVEQSGMPQDFLRAFERIALDQGTVCGRAALAQKTVFVPDVEKDEACRPFREVARAVPFRSLLSSPLIAGPGSCIGIVSVHFANRFLPSTLELQSLERYCRQLAGVLLERGGQRELPAIAESLSARLLAAG